MPTEPELTFPRARRAPSSFSAHGGPAQPVDGSSDDLARCAPRPSRACSRDFAPRGLRTLAIGAALLFAACSAPTSDPPRRDASTAMPDASVPAPDARVPMRDARSGGDTGDGCDADTDCASMLCVRATGEAIGFCSEPCEGSIQCPPGMSCGVAPDGARLCVPRACDPIGPNEGYVCSGGVSTSCEQADRDEFCEECGCGAASLRCEPEGCVALAEVGDACDEDDDCRSLNCSQTEFVCRVPVGSSCDETNCDRCQVHEETGWRFCSRPCSDDEQCHGGGRCVGERDSGYFCTAYCDSSCPTHCNPVRDGGQVCACNACDVRTPQERALYTRCDYDSHCASDSCLGYEMCTTSCSSDAECGEAGRCVALPCAEGQSVACGNVCMPACDSRGDCRVGECTGLQSASGEGGVSVCDPRRRDGLPCEVSRECQSGRCGDTTCIPMEGLQNGGRCTAASDCASGRCSGGACRGDGLIGDACEVGEDCAVGTCCDGACGTEC